MGICYVSGGYFFSSKAHLHEAWPWLTALGLLEVAEIVLRPPRG